MTIYTNAQKFGWVYLLRFMKVCLQNAFIQQQDLGYFVNADNPANKANFIISCQCLMLNLTLNKSYKCGMVPGTGAHPTLYTGIPVETSLYKSWSHTCMTAAFGLLTKSHMHTHQYLWLLGAAEKYEIIFHYNNL